MKMRGNARLEGGTDPKEQMNTSGSGDYRTRDDVVRVSPHLQKMISARAAARALGRRKAPKIP